MEPYPNPMVDALKVGVHTGSVITVPLYVDDGRYYFDSKGDSVATAKKDMKAFATKFDRGKVW